MSAVPALRFILSAGVTSFLLWIFIEVIDQILAAGVHQTTGAFPFLQYAWVGFPVIWLFFAGLELIKNYNKKEYDWR